MTGAAKSDFNTESGQDSGDSFFLLNKVQESFSSAYGVLTSPLRDSKGDINFKMMQTAAAVLVLTAGICVSLTAGWAGASMIIFGLLNAGRNLIWDRASKKAEENKAGTALERAMNKSFMEKWGAIGGVLVHVASLGAAVASFMVFPNLVDGINMAAYSVGLVSFVSLAVKNNILEGRLRDKFSPHKDKFRTYWTNLEETSFAEGEIPDPIPEKEMNRLVKEYFWRRLGPDEFPEMRFDDLYTFYERIGQPDGIWKRMRFDREKRKDIYDALITVCVRNRILKIAEKTGRIPDILRNTDGVREEELQALGLSKKELQDGLSKQSILSLGQAFKKGKITPELLQRIKNALSTEDLKSLMQTLETRRGVSQDDFNHQTLFEVLGRIERDAHAAKDAVDAEVEALKTKTDFNLSTGDVEKKPYDAKDWRRDVSEFGMSGKALYNVAPGAMMYARAGAFFAVLGMTITTMGVLPAACLFTAGCFYVGGAHKRLAEDCETYKEATDDMFTSHAEIPENERYVLDAKTA